MSRVLACLGRFAVVVVGFFSAALAASAFFHLMVLAGGVDLSEEGARDLMDGRLLASIWVVSALIAYTAFLPAFVFFVVAEIFGWRGWLSYALGGGAIAMLALYAAAGTVGNPSSTGGRFELLLVACGMVGGFVYWAVTGRRAGIWLHGPAGPTVRTPSGS